MSSFLQRTLGWGSPCTWQRNSTVSSSRTTWLIGLRRKVGLSAAWAQKKAQFHYVRIWLCFISHIAQFRHNYPSNYSYFFHYLIFLFLHEAQIYSNSALNGPVTYLEI